MINQRIFSANVGEPSTGNKGPDAIEQDIDNLLANDQELLGITGSKANLTTDDKTNLVAAINEHETQINSLDAEVDLKADKAQPNWITATLQNGWTGTLQYRKNQIGQLEVNLNLNGTAATIASGTLITQLPVGYRPLRNVPFDAYVASSGVWVRDCFILQSDGNLYIRNTIDSGVKQHLGTVQTMLVLPA